MWPTGISWVHPRPSVGRKLVQMGDAHYGLAAKLNVQFLLQITLRCAS